MFKTTLRTAFAAIFFLLTILISQAHDNGKGTRRSRSRQSNECNLFKGSWIMDPSYPIYNGSECPFVDSGLNCQKNGRDDTMYLKFRWQPHRCALASFSGKRFLRRNRGKKIMFVGDSLSSNQWQSLACMLYHSVPSTKHTFTREGPLSNLSFPEYGVSVMYLKNGFLVDLVVEKESRVLKLDSISRGGKWEGVDVLIFNSYHWWTHSGSLQTWDYYQVGEEIYKDMGRMEAYKIALTTWAKWVDSNINPNKTRVFFQGISAIHDEGKDWNEPNVRNCQGQTLPIHGLHFPGKRYPGQHVVKGVLVKMKNPAYLLDITLLTQLRKDGHPSIYGDEGRDCSHWCLAGVPDTWNQILYNILLKK
ncbi:unnamed protein product [Lactuca saligna]|uniref:Trichome birefringence-like N-terminal domain-containing protein n=1 Tax=Lactuca saligna TaxID=75948 RepID=A0AA36EQ99_LACSI|nr:unnamed protein product [Lactuca saligna]